MLEPKGSGGGESSRASPKLVEAGDRQLLTLDLRPGETTYVSWKKLLKDAKRDNGSSASVPDPPTNVNPILESRLSPGRPAGTEMIDQPPPNRFSAVIEKIERLYMGKDSSDGEELDGSPDDDEYDTEDSFIDDAELDKYFEVDNSAIKHDGFFINRGKLERIIDTPAMPIQQPKKRKKKDFAKKAHGFVSNKQAKMAEMTTGKAESSLPEHYSDPSQSLSMTNEYANAKAQNQSKAASSFKVSSSGASLSVEAAVRQKKKNDMRELQNTKICGSKQPRPKHLHAHKRDGSNVRPKSSMLEKAIRELERVVAESRPSAAIANREADTSSQAVKRRLPREVKLKLAKVAGIAASQGRLSKELINRLMSIVGHLIQLRSLKRNLKIMITGMSANQEKDGRFQQIKKEVVEMIKLRVPSVNSQAFEQQAGTSVDFQEFGSAEKGAVKKKPIMDAALEDKICDLYDLFVDGLDGDAGPQIRKLYVELAELWPNRLMDNRGIKRAICRAKERRRALNGKDTGQGEARRSVESVRVDAGSNHPGPV